MSFQQLYYTSCEVGLSGYAGYQFNAVTDETSGETMRAVEALASYEPPHSLAQASDPADLERCPVNLCFAPGPATVLASVSYVGRDSSNRVGNYFAHALATNDLDADDADLLPIELWQAPWWARSPAPTTSLPAVCGPLATGPLSREAVAQYLDAHPDRARLTALLTAAGLAHSRGDRSVLVVADSAQEVAHWFAAVSYLLPPRWVRHLSFSTYLSRPSRSRLHLLGTLPETNLDLGPDAGERFYLFDFPGQRFAELPVHPLGRLCDAIGVTALPTLWGWAESLATARETSLDDWYPVVAAAAALGRVPLTAGDLSAVAAWLRERDDLEAGSRNAVARAVHDQPAAGQDILPALRDVSAATGDDGLWEQVQYELLEPLLLGRTNGQQVWAAHTGQVPPRCAAAAVRVRDQMTGTAEGQLRLTQDAQEALSLLDWSGQAGLPVDPDLLAESGRRLIGPLLTADSAGARRLTAAQRDQAARVTSQWAQVREGIVVYLTKIAQDRPELAATAMSGLAGELLSPPDMTRGSPIRVFYLVYAAVRRGEDPVRILHGLVRAGEVSEAGELLLNLLWPNGRWSVADAAAALSTVDTAVLATAAGWFEATLATEPAAAERRAYARLCAGLMESALARQLATPQRPAASEVRDLRRAYDTARRVADLQPAIRAVAAAASVPATVLATEWIAPRLASLPADKPDEITLALSRLSKPAVRRYLTVTDELFGHPVGSSAMHAAALYLSLTSRAESMAWVEEHADAINRLLVRAVRQWSPERLEETAALIDGSRVTAGREFREDVSHLQAGRRRWLVSTLRAILRRRRGERG